MTAIIFLTFSAIFLAAGLAYYRFCKDVAESLSSMMADDEKTKKEGGDNWPSGSITPDDIIAGRRLSDREKEERIRGRESSKKKELLRSSCF